MAFKDISFDLKPSDKDGLADLVDRFQVDQDPRTRQRFLEQPYLRQLVTDSHGWIDIWPDWIVARLLTICLPAHMKENDALAKIRGPIEMELKPLACRDLPVLEFHGAPFKGTECGRPVWKIKSKPAAWIAQLRQRIRVLAQRLGFDTEVKGLVEPEDEVHIYVRGRYAVGTCPALPLDQSDLRMTFHKVGFRRRFAFGVGTSEPFGSMLSVNFGASTYVDSGDAKHIEFLSDISDSLTFPSARDANRPTIQNGERLARSVSARPPVLALHASTSFPLESDVEVAKAASLFEADRVAAPHNARIGWGLSENLQRRLFTESLVLLKVSRDPLVYHKELGTCAELQECREALEAAGKNFCLPSGAKAFVRPEQHASAMKAAELRRGLRPQHVIVSQDLEDNVMKAIRRIPCNSKVNVRTKTTLPSGLATEAAYSVMNLKVERTFIQVDVPSSLRPSASGGPWTASTSEVHKSKNPRRA